FYDAGIDHALVDLTTERQLPPVLFWGGGPMSPDDARHLRTYAEGGGELVFWGEYPPVDELPVVAPDGAYANGYMDTFHKDITIMLGGARVTLEAPAQVGTFSRPPGQPILGELIAPDRVISDNVLDEYRALTTLGVGERLVVGYRASVGQGKVTVLALERVAALVGAIHEGVGVEIAA